MKNKKERKKKRKEKKKKDNSAVVENNFHSSELFLLMPMLFFANVHCSYSSSSSSLKYSCVKAPKLGDLNSSGNVRCVMRKVTSTYRYLRVDT